MNNTSSIYIHSQTALPKEYSNLLKEGSSVLVRILKQTSSNTWTASFAGGRFTIKSETPLKTGDRFMAKISFADGKLNLTPTTSALVQNENVSQKVQSFNTLNPQSMQLLASLGLPADNISKMLVQTLVSGGAKINIEKINKARIAALNFPGREDEAGEAAMILIEKGIEPTIENIGDILTGFSIEEKEYRKFSIKDKSDYSLEEIEKELKEYFFKLLDTASEVNNEIKPGFITVFNHIVSRRENSSREKGETDPGLHWVILPFECQFEKGEQLVKASGVIRVFIDLSQKSIKKTVINFNFNGTIATFVVNLNKGNVENLHFNVAPEKSSEIKQAYEKKLASLFNGIPVSYESFESLMGFASGETPLSTVKELA